MLKRREKESATVMGVPEAWEKELGIRMDDEGCRWQV